MAARVVEVILVSETRGKGVSGDPVRDVVTIWTLDGELLAELDTAGTASTHNPIGARLAADIAKRRRDP